MHNISKSTIKTHGMNLYGKVSMLLMAILLMVRWNSIPQVKFEHAGKRDISGTAFHHPHRWKGPNTWLKASQNESSLLLSYLTCVGSACAILNHTYYQSTPTFQSINTILMRMHKGIRYKVAGNLSVSLKLIQVSIGNETVDRICLSRKRHEVLGMEAEGSRCAAANRDLQEAKGGYETRTAARIKRKIAELEAQAKQEEEGRTEEEVAGEVDWLKDPGTPSRRATQFVRTKVESWRTKTLIAKALESIEKEKQHIVTEVNLTEAQMAKIVDYNSALDNNISTVHEAIQTLNRKLTLLIRLLRDTINTATPTPKPAPTEEDQPEPIEAIQEKVDRHVREIGLDTIAQMGKYI